jgi:hypothetical protein
MLARVPQTAQELVRASMPFKQQSLRMDLSAFPSALSHNGLLAELKQTHALHETDRPACVPEDARDAAALPSPGGAHATETNRMRWCCSIRRIGHPDPIWRAHTGCLVSGMAWTRMGA